jgi:hypothetical protein
MGKFGALSDEVTSVKIFSAYGLAKSSLELFVISHFGLQRNYLPSYLGLGSKLFT